MVVSPAFALLKKKLPNRDKVNNEILHLQDLWLQTAQKVNLRFRKGEWATRVTSHVGSKKETRSFEA